MYLLVNSKNKVQILHQDGTREVARGVTSVTDPETAQRLNVALNGIETDSSGLFWRAEIDALLGVLPSAVAAAVREELARYEPGTVRTWTFFGHWEASRIVVEYSLPGVVTDTRADTGTWEEGLWAASGDSLTEAAAQARVTAEYENADDPDDCTVCERTGLALPPGQSTGTEAECWFCDGKTAGR